MNQQATMNRNLADRIVAHCAAALRRRMVELEQDARRRIPAGCRKPDCVPAGFVRYY